MRLAAMILLAWATTCAYGSGLEVPAVVYSAGIGEQNWVLLGGIGYGPGQLTSSAPGLLSWNVPETPGGAREVKVLLFEVGVLAAFQGDLSAMTDMGRLIPSTDAVHWHVFREQQRAASIFVSNTEGVPEPSSGWLGAGGLAMLAAWRGRKLLRSFVTPAFKDPRNLY
jgi:hypothetical protein